MTIKKAFGLESILAVSQHDLDTLCQRISMKEEIKKEISIDGQGNYLWKDLQAGRTIPLGAVI